MSLSLADVTVRGRLEGISLGFDRNMVTAICGPNGAGKSTLLGCLAGLMKPDSGDVLLGDAPLAKMDSLERGRWMGYLPQAPEVAWDVAVETLVSLGRLPWVASSASEAQAAIDAAIRTMDLEALRHRPVSQLSGGERARALMARVLATKPGWLLADEPLANLDLGHAAMTMRKMREQARAGCGVVLVLHDLGSAMNCADRVVVLQDGRVAADGHPDDALASDVIREVWGVRARWLGEQGARALAV
ncbi:ABC transporter ATP-binding protein [Novosphingobium sp. 9]|uniref:ABC transporter ATP-binding protein n=1 Tax=Novosphingobium sp. 9 TaxID=2025349 RepID=UPI0021B622E5|nr:ABC transporter ATP-binding protein [Novosphingobium sp. 9]